VKKLINAKCDVNVQDNYLETALHEAVRNNKDKAISILMERGSL